MWFIWTIPAGLRNRAGLLSVLPILGLALIIGCSTKGQPYSLEERAYEIDRSLMCPVCPGETISQSQVLLAKQMRDIVREKLAAGESKEQILQFFVDRYPTISMLAAPPKKGFNLIVWIVPPAVLVLGALGLVLVIRNMGKHASTLYEREQSAGERELEPYLSMVDRELAELETSGAGDRGDPEADRSREGGS